MEQGLAQSQLYYLLQSSRQYGVRKKRPNGRSEEKRAHFPIATRAFENKNKNKKQKGF